MTIRKSVALTSLFALVGLAYAGDEATGQGKVATKGAAAQSSFDPCTLLTYDEIKSAVGWKPDSATKKGYGTTGTCTYHGPNAMLQNVAVMVGQGLADMSDSKKMAAWRAKQYVDNKITDAIVEPIGDLGVPAIRNEFGVVSVEMAVGTQLLTVTGLSVKFEQAKKLAAFALARKKKP